MRKSFLFVIIVLASGCSSVLNENDYLQKVSENLDAIKSASYISIRTASAPGDTTRFTDPMKFNFKIFINPSDTLVGASSAKFPVSDSTKMTEFYDGYVSGQVDWDEQYVKVDSFKNNRAPFRLVYYPFYPKINEIIKYTLTTKDSILTDFVDYGDSVFFSLKIINKQTYFHIKPITITNEYTPRNITSQFDIWFNKSDNMPYRMRSKWFHATSFEECYNASFNTTKDEFFKAADYYPEYFVIKQLTRSKRKNKSDMIGEKAPGWILKDINIQDVKLSDLKSSVLLIQFTGIGCGPCHKSIPFLNQLADDYKNKDFELLSIETWSNNFKGIRRYVENNGINFKFLNATDEVNQSYQISSVPTFFIIDKNRVIRKVITGYSRNTTDKKIRDAIDELL